MRQRENCDKHLSKVVYEVEYGHVYTVDLVFGLKPTFYSSRFSPNDVNASD